MSKDIKKALEHCIEWNCIDCPNREELGSGETVCRGRLLPEVLEYVADLEAKLTEKDAERELDNSFWKQECDSLQKTLVEKDKEIEQVTSKLQASYEKKQNQKAIKELEKLKETLIPLRNLEIEAIRKTNEYEFNSLEARKYWVANHKESSKTYDNMIKKIDNQINVLRNNKYGKH